jgi:hypothetical protein
MFNASQQPGILKLDFTRFFPYKFWISDWGADSTYPDGFRYKLLSARDEKDGTIEVVLLLQAKCGAKQEMHGAEVKLDGFDEYVGVFVDGLVSEYGIEFEEQDFSRVRSAEEFEKADFE